MDFKKAPAPTLVELNESSAQRTVFCVHPAGGGVSYYDGMAKALEPYAKFYALEEPFIYDDFAYDSLPELAEYHVEVIRSVQPQGPYTVFGYCSGGVIAYEIACQLHLSGEAVDSVALFGSQLVNGFDPEERERVLFLRDYLAAKFGVQIAHLEWDHLETLSFRDVAAVIVDEVSKQQTQESGSDLGWAARCVEAMCLMRNATRKYKASRSKLDIALYKWDYLDPVAVQKIKPWCDWDALTSGKLTMIEPPQRNGAAVDILFPPYLQETVQRVKRVSLGLS